MLIKHPYYFEARTYASSGKEDPYGKFSKIVATGGPDSLLISDIEQFKKSGNGKALFGYLSYELNRRFEHISSTVSPLKIPEIGLFEPDDYRFENTIEDALLPEIDLTWNQMLRPDFSKKEYIETLKSIQNHLQLGDIYELTFCIQLKGNVKISNPYNLFERLCSQNPNPFSVILKMGEHWVISASPERYIVKRDSLLASQPIKGTAPRSLDEKTDKKLKKELQLSEKERAENVMIVDLVRNDLSRIAQKGTVKVTELFGVHSFPSVHQLISTIECKVMEDKSPYDIFKASFPPGSMTGAPKVRAMQLIESFEKNQRGIYSGSIGYLMPNGDMDFNVVIRSIIYNEKTGEISIPIGGAITIQSDPENEYKECKLKALASLKALNLDTDQIKW